jgi:hypothetical protein
MQLPWNPMEWASEHWQELIGWSALATFFYRAWFVAKRIIGFGEGVEETRADLKTIMTNHLPHLQIELESVNSKLSDLHSGMHGDIDGLREDLRDGLNRLNDSINVLLTRVP